MKIIKKFIFNIKFILILTVTFLLVFLFWMQKNDGFYIFTYLGSLHTGDYALISEYLINNNFIPSVKKKYCTSFTWFFNINIWSW